MSTIVRYFESIAVEYPQFDWARSHGSLIEGYHDGIAIEIQVNQKEDKHIVTASPSREERPRDVIYLSWSELIAGLEGQINECADVVVERLRDKRK